MSRAERLLQLMQQLRLHRFPVSGQALATTLGISLRTLYRDIASLQAQGADIRGEAGLGYVLKPGYQLPPLMLAEEEIEALMLGTRWVARHGDNDLAEAARHLTAKIEAVLPQKLQDYLAGAPLLVAAPRAPLPCQVDVAQIREAIRRERKLRIRYQDQQGQESQRLIWPIAIGFFEQVRIVAAWCESRQAFRHFRTDRLLAIELLAEPYPGRRQLMHQWRQVHGQPPQGY
ncbi:YafY family protein [Gallaecimonas kandeliae]|uniref:helix-turn-helix transcriptional regulator n=1 Tax=Gallaecimonas kandeliae TaxID=3029055 RepID=UPI00264823D9|nr:YafY family protein [Gallaecimonas kandeliae]WKE66129.1 YafY family protein [Gallaecimonas kandeliae]